MIGIGRHYIKITRVKKTVAALKNKHIIIKKKRLGCKPVCHWCPAITESSIILSLCRVVRWKKSTFRGKHRRLSKNEDIKKRALII